MEWEDTTTEKDNGQKAADSATAKLSLTCLPDLVLHHIISGLEWPEAVALRQVDRACRDLVLRDHRPLQFVLTHLVPRALAALPPDLATSPYHAKYWDWFKRVQTRDFAMDAPLPDDDGRDEDDDEDEDDFELESDELELLKQEAEMPLPPPHSEDDSPAADAMLIDNQPSATSVDDDQDDDNGQEEKMEVAAAEAVAVVADDKVEHELNDLQACRLLIESRLHQLAIMEPTYWAACRNACTKEPWREAQIAQILSIVKKARLSVVSSPLSVGESSAKIRAYTRIGGQEAITVGCLLELVCPGDHRWTFHIRERRSRPQSRLYRQRCMLKIRCATENGFTRLFRWADSAFKPATVNHEPLSELAHQLGLGDWAKEDVVRFLLDCAGCTNPPYELDDVTTLSEQERATFLALVDGNHSAVGLETMLRTVQRLQFHLQKPCIMRVGSEIDFVSADDIRRLLPRLAGGIATAATAAMDKFESECYAIGSARLVVPDGGVTVLCKMTYVEHEVYGDQVRIDMAGRTDCPSISERFGLSCGAITPIMTFFTVPDAKDLPDAPAVVFFDELARLIGVFPDDCGDGHDKEDADDHELEQRDVDEESAVLAVMDAGKERRLRMALTLVTCIIGPATRYDGLRCPSDEDFWDGLKPRMWFHTDPVEVLLTHCVQVWADEQTTGFA